MALENDLESEQAYMGESGNTKFQLETLCHRDSISKYMETKVDKYGSETQKFSNI